jgi:hypothetical protein
MYCSISHRQDIYLSGQFEDLLFVDEEPVDVPILRIDLFRRRVLGIKDDNFYSKGIRSFAEHLTKLASAEESNCTVHGGVLLHVSVVKMKC